MLGKMDCSGLTHPGLVRPANEDQYLIATLNKSMQVHSTSLNLDDQTRLFGSSQGRLLVVADGMGGHAAGERASTIAIDGLATYLLNTMHWYFRLREDSEEQFLDELKDALGFCQEKILAEGERVPERFGMGTTVTMAYLVWPRMYVVHAGDSRCYLLRGSKLRQVTRDHTVAQRMADEGALDDPESSRWSHVLYNVVGGKKDSLNPEVYRADLKLGDTVLLCTDGLSKYVGEPALTRMLKAPTLSEETCRRLIDAANDAGGKDNVTAVVAHFRDARQQQGMAEAAVEQIAVPASERDTAEMPAVAVAG